MDHYRWLLLACLGFTAVFSIQIIYWYYVSGHLVFNPYQGEGFNFLEPKIHKGWFDFANGWLVYTPIMGLALIGLFSLSSYRTGLLWPILAFSCLTFGYIIRITSGRIFRDWASGRW
jgi:hypothetical protein